MLVFEFPVQRQALLKQGLCAIVVALNEGQVGREDERLRLHGCLDSLACCQCALQEVAPFTDVSMYYPESSQLSPQSQGHLHAARTFRGLLIPSSL